MARPDSRPPPVTTSQADRHPGRRLPLTNAVLLLVASLAAFVLTHIVRLIAANLSESSSYDDKNYVPPDRSRSSASFRLSDGR
jgi:hypothetical protein